MLNLSRDREHVRDGSRNRLAKGNSTKSLSGPGTWWARNPAKLSNLHPLIAEQWIYRHWSRSYSSFLRLEPLTWRLEAWPSSQILRDVHLEFGGPMKPDNDYRAFNGERGFGLTPTARALK